MNLEMQTATYPPYFGICPTSTAVTWQISSEYGNTIPLRRAYTFRAHLSGLGSVLSLGSKLRGSNYSKKLDIKKKICPLYFGKCSPSTTDTWQISSEYGINIPLRGAYTFRAHSSGLRSVLSLGSKLQGSNHSKKLDIKKKICPLYFGKFPSST